MGTLKFCKHTGCRNLVKDGYCEKHKDEANRYVDGHKGGSSRQRGYDWRWQKYTKWFLSQPENAFCKLHLDNKCAVVAQCVDHIDPPDGPNDPKFWDKNNHQAACIHCNSVKGHRNRRGNFEF